MALNPVGPLPASTYWRRRAALLLGLVVVLFLLKSCAAGGHHKKTAAKTTPRPTVTSPPVTPKPTSSSTPVSADLVCTDAQLSLTTTTDAAAYGVGGNPKITLTIKNTSAAACREDLGEGAVELLVFSSSDRIWSSADCNPSKATSVELIPAGGSRAVVRTWNEHRSKPDCTGPKAAAKPGNYYAVGRLATLTKRSTGFAIHS